MYISTDWLKDKKNEKAVYEILNGDTDIVFGEDTRVKKLREIGENTIADKLTKGEIILNG